MASAVLAQSDDAYIISIKAIDDDEITIDINDGHTPAVIKCSVPFLYVLMPLRIN